MAQGQIWSGTVVTDSVFNGSATVVNGADTAGDSYTVHNKLALEGRVTLTYGATYNQAAVLWIAGKNSQADQESYVNSAQHVTVSGAANNTETRTFRVDEPRDFEVRINNPSGANITNVRVEFVDITFGDVP